MRKLVIALVATSAIAGQAAAEIRSGFYVGANVSANALLAKGKFSYTDQAESISNRSDLGRFGGGLGLYAGYGMLSGCMYYAAELAYDWNSAQAKQSIRAVDNNVTLSSNVKIKDPHVFNFAVLGGWKVNPSTVLYVRLGGNVSEAKMSASASDGVNTIKLGKSKSRVSFVPGVGFETSFHKNWVGRMEYTYDFGNSVKKSVTHPTGDVFTASVKNVNTHSVKLGIAYKF